MFWKKLQRYFIIYILIFLQFLWIWYFAIYINFKGYVNKIFLFVAQLDQYACWSQARYIWDIRVIRKVTLFSPYFWAYFLGFLKPMCCGIFVLVVMSVLVLTHEFVGSTLTLTKHSHNKNKIIIFTMQVSLIINY
jgi:hypothetical protein